jgi:hypothetical protein
VRRLLPVALLLALASAFGTHEARAGECGIPDSRPLWVDYAGHDSPVPHRPGLTLAFSSGTDKPAQARAAGAATVLFDLNFNNRVGTPTTPNDPATMVDRADRLYDYAVSITACTTPWIALNELFGAQTPTPWTKTTAQYRANVLALTRRLTERGSRVFVTIANPPYTGGEAEQWWRDLAASAVLVRQVYFTAPNVPQLHAMGPVRASRSMRRGMRGLVRKFTEIGIPANRVALELQFQSFVGQGGRENLQPAWKWFEIVKLEALAAKQVTKELGTHSIWSWGWATFSVSGVDKDKPGAVCVYLWARDPRLCDGPGAAGPRFDASLTTGQLNLAAGVQCQLPGGSITTRAIATLAAALGDRDLAASVLLERAVLTPLVPVNPQAVLIAEDELVALRFGGSVPLYVRTLRAVRLSRDAMRALLADDLRRDAIRARFAPPRPGEAAISAFRMSYGGFGARLVEVKQPVPWLGWRTRGFALESFAPHAVFTIGRAGRIATTTGPVLVRPLGPTVPLGALLLPDARPAIETALEQLARASVYDGWLAKAEASALAQATCLRDELPEPAAVDVESLLF